MQRSTRRPAPAETARAAQAAPAAQITGFVGKFDPAIARVIRSCRTTLRKRFPTAIELVYDNYNFLVFGFSATERPSDCIVSLAAAASGVGLSFYYGSTIPDPDGLLLGSGSQNRFVRLPDAGTLKTPGVAALIDAAVAQAKTPLAATGRGYTVIRSVSAKQRPRRRNRAAVSRRG
jgi:hypothetical protein